MTWLESDSFHVDKAFCFDSLTTVMLVVVTIISTLVHLYSTEYMGEYPHLPRFMSYLSLFTFLLPIQVSPWTSFCAPVTILVQCSMDMYDTGNIGGLTYTRYIVYLQTKYYGGARDTEDITRER